MPHILQVNQAALEGVNLRQLAITHQINDTTLHYVVRNKRTFIAWDILLALYHHFKLDPPGLFARAAALGANQANQYSYASWGLLALLYDELKLDIPPFLERVETEDQP